MTWNNLREYFGISLLISLLWLVCIIVYFLLHNKPFFHNAKNWVKWLIMIGAIILFLQWKDDIKAYKNVVAMRDYAAIDEGLRQFVEQKGNELSYSDQLNGFRSGKLNGKMIAFEIELMGNHLLENRINNQLKKHDQFSSNPDSIDYVILFLSHWETAYYDNHCSSSTEMANVYVVDYKTDSIVSIVNFYRNKNSRPTNLRIKRRSKGVHEKHELEDEELYYGIVNGI